MSLSENSLAEPFRHVFFEVPHDAIRIRGLQWSDCENSRTGSLGTCLNVEVQSPLVNLV